MKNTNTQEQNNMLRRLKRIQGVTVTGGRIFCVACLLAIIACTTLSVFFRYVFFFPLNFSDPLSVLLLTWMVFVGAGLAVYSGEHVIVDYFISRFPKKMKIAAAVASVLLISFLCLVIAHYGFSFAWIMRDSRDPLVFNLSMLVPYISVPVGASYTLLQLWLVAGIAICEKGRQSI